jgi:hypothetical protein
MKTKKKFILLILLSLAYTGLQTQPLYSDYYINPLNTWSSAPGGVVFYNDTTFVAGIGGYNFMYNEKVIIFIKLDGEGAPVHQKIYGELGFEYYPGFSGCFRRVDNDNFVFPIVKRDLFTTLHTSILYYIDSNFDTLYVNEFIYEVDKSTLARQIVSAFDGGFYVTGGHALTAGNNTTGQNMFILKTDAQFNKLWQRSHYLAFRCEPLYMETTPDHGLLISGFTRDEYPFYSRKPFIAKTDSLGNLEWVWNEGSYPYSYDDGWAVCGMASDGNYLMAYTHATYQGPPYPVPPSEMVLRVVKFSPHGDAFWAKDYGPSAIWHEVRSLRNKDDGTSLIAGFRYDKVVERWKAYILNINNEGDSLWMREYEHMLDVDLATWNQINHINLTPSNTILAVGQVQYHYPPGLQAMWIMHLDEYGCPVADCDTTVGIMPSVVAEYAGLTVYPNPASKYCTLRVPLQFAHTRNHQLMLRIFNAQGSMILSRNIEYGNGTADIDVSQLTPGLYILQLTDNRSNIGHTRLIIH